MTVPDSDLNNNRSNAKESFPEAIVARNVTGLRFPGVVIWVSIIALLVASGVSYLTLRSTGIEITISFEDGAGLKVGDSLRHRGVEVGAITQIKLDPSLDRVMIVARVDEQASLVATEGTRFWIVRPEASFRGLNGLDTLLSGQYIAVDPSRRKPKAMYHFAGLSSPPATSLPGESLEIMLEASMLGGLQNAAPLLFRGLEVGKVQSIALSPDSQRVRVEVSVDADYRSLVRDNTNFWNVSGLKMDMGFRGLAVQASSLSSIAVGGIGFATPEPPGQPVVTGHRFELQPEPPKQWQEWNTPIATGPAMRLDMETMPPMQLAVLRWKTSFYGFSRTQTRSGWILPLSDGSVLGPSDLFHPPNESLADSALLECVGQTWALKDLKSQLNDIKKLSSSSNIRIKLDGFPIGIETWPAERMGQLDSSKLKAMELVLLCEGNQRYIPMEPTQLSFENESIFLPQRSNFPQPINGAAILNVADGKLVGIVHQTRDEDRPEILLFELLPQR